MIIHTTAVPEAPRLVTPRKSQWPRNGAQYIFFGSCTNVQTTQLQSWTLSHQLQFKACKTLQQLRAVNEWRRAWCNADVMGRTSVVPFVKEQQAKNRPYISDPLSSRVRVLNATGLSYTNINDSTRFSCEKITSCL